jgi:hypothetical protein
MANRLGPSSPPSYPELRWWYGLGCCSSAETQSWEDMIGLFSLETFRNLARAFLMYSAFAVLPMGTSFMYITPLASKKMRTMVQIVWTLAFLRPSWPFLTTVWTAALSLGCGRIRWTCPWLLYCSGLPMVSPKECHEVTAAVHLLLFLGL